MAGFRFGGGNVSNAYRSLGIYPGQGGSDPECWPPHQPGRIRDPVDDNQNLRAQCSADRPASLRSSFDPFSVGRDRPRASYHLRTLRLHSGKTRRSFLPLRRAHRRLCWRSRLRHASYAWKTARTRLGPTLPPLATQQCQPSAQPISGATCETLRVFRAREPVMRNLSVTVNVPDTFPHCWNALAPFERFRLGLKIGVSMSTGRIFQKRGPYNSPEWRPNRCY
jgi:hypothetical protein